MANVEKSQPVKSIYLGRKRSRDRSPSGSKPPCTNRAGAGELRPTMKTRPPKVMMRTEIAKASVSSMATRGASGPAAGLEEVQAAGPNRDGGGTTFPARL
jgi:hypothetical protein